MVNGWQRVRPSPFCNPANLTTPNVGHYARKGWKTPSGSSIPRPQLLRSSDPTKDQNYYLSAIPEDGLARALFPLGDLTKADVRRIAEAACLPTAQRDESMGICFVGQKRKFSEFLGEGVPVCPYSAYLWPYVHTTCSFSELPGTESRPHLQNGHRDKCWNPSRTVDIHDRPRSPVTGIKGEAFRRCKEQRRECCLRGERLVRPLISFVRVRPILTQWLATTHHYTRLVLYAETGSGSGLTHPHRR